MIVAIRADQRCHVADTARNIGHVEHRHVHRHVPDNRNAHAGDQHGAAIAERAAIAVAVPDTKRRDPAIAVGAIRSRVAHGLAVANGSDVDDPRAQGHDRFRRNRRRIAAADAIEENAGSSDGPRRWSAVFDRRAVLGMNHRRTDWQPRERRREALLLERTTGVVLFSGMKMRERALRRMGRKHVGQAINLVPADSGSAHSSIDRQLPGTPGLRPSGDRRGVAERRREIRANRCVEVAGKDRCEDDDGPRNRDRAQLLGLGDGGDAESPRVETFQRPRNALGPESIGVGLHHGQQWDVGARGEGGSVA